MKPLTQKIHHPALYRIVMIGSQLFVALGMPFTFADTLSLDQALKDASQGSLSIQASDAAKESSEWSTVEARSGFLPKLNFDAIHYFNIKYQTLNINLGGQSQEFPFVSPATNYQLNASWNIFNGFADTELLGAAKLREHAANNDLAWARFQVEQDVRLNFFSYLAAKQLDAVSAENVANLETHLQQVEDMLKVGEAIQVDVLRVQVQLNTARSQRINAQDQVIISQQHLAQALGKSSESRTPDGMLPIPDPNIAKDIDALSKQQQQEIAKRSDLEAASLRTQAVEKSATAASRYWVPSLSVVGSYQWYNNTTFEAFNPPPFKSAWQYGLELKWNIFDGLLSYARSKEAAAESLRSAKMDQLSKLQASTDVATNSSEYRFQLSQFIANTDNLERSKRSVQLALSGLKHGTQTNTDVLDAELDLFNSRAGVIQSQLRALEAQIKFENAIGRKI